MCKGVIAMCLEDGSIHRFNAKNTVLATGSALMIKNNFVHNYYTKLFTICTIVSHALITVVMVEPISRVRLPTLVLVMVQQWCPGLD